MSTKKTVKTEISPRLYQPKGTTPKQAEPSPRKTAPASRPSTTKSTSAISPRTPTKQKAEPTAQKNPSASKSKTKTSKILLTPSSNKKAEVIEITKTPTNKQFESQYSTFAPDSQTPNALNEFIKTGILETPTKETTTKSALKMSPESKEFLNRIETEKDPDYEELYHEIKPKWETLYHSNLKLRKELGKISSFLQLLRNSYIKKKAELKESEDQNTILNNKIHEIIEHYKDLARNPDNERILEIENRYKSEKKRTKLKYDEIIHNIENNALKEREEYEFKIKELWVRIKDLQQKNNDLAAKNEELSEHHGDVGKLNLYLKKANIEIARLDDKNKEIVDQYETELENRNRKFKEIIDIKDREIQALKKKLGGSVDTGNPDYEKVLETKLKKTKEKIEDIQKLYEEKTTRYENNTQQQKDIITNLENQIDNLNKAAELQQKEIDDLKAKLKERSEEVRESNIKLGEYLIDKKNNPDSETRQLEQVENNDKDIFSPPKRKAK